MNAQESSRPLIVLIPVFNDWPAVSQLLRHLDQELRLYEQPARVLLLDDGSSEPIPDELHSLQPTFLTHIDVLHLRRNLGHQRALAVGLSYVEANFPCDAVIVMDGDGEDAPADVPRLLRKFAETGGKQIVFAERTRRSETLLFRIFYKLYRAVHLLLTGERVRVGNFSVVPFALLTRLVVVSDLWNHYAAAVFKARLPYTMVPSERGRRYAGQSRMNFISLVVHGLSAMSVFGERIGVRLLTATACLALLTLFALAATLAVRFGTGWAIPGWATYTAGILLVILFQMLAVSIIFVFIVLAGRDSSTFLPLRDHVYFVYDCQSIFQADERVQIRR